jgi:hypothetical protein
MVLERQLQGKPPQSSSDIAQKEAKWRVAKMRDPERSHI